MSLRAPPCLSVNRLAGTGWRVDYIMSSSLLQSVEEPMVHLRLEVAAAPEAPAQPVALSLSADKFQVLLAGKAQLYPERLGPSQIPPDSCPLLTSSLAELKQAQTLMSSLG